LCEGTCTRIPNLSTLGVPAMARIFVVEDNESLREAVCSYLRLNDHEIVEFPRIGGVLEAIETKPPDLIVLDVMLPDGDGFLLARKIRKDHAVPIIFLTAKATESDRITGFSVEENAVKDVFSWWWACRGLTERSDRVTGNRSILPDILVHGKEQFDLLFGGTE